MRKTIFVVEGSDGSYSDRTTWLVAAFSSRSAAQDFADKCRAEEVRVAEERRAIEARFDARREKAGVADEVWSGMGEDRRAVWMRLLKQEQVAVKKVQNIYDPTESGRDAGYGVCEVPMMDDDTKGGPRG